MIQLKRQLQARLGCFPPRDFGSVRLPVPGWNMRPAVPGWKKRRRKAFFLGVPGRNLRLTSIRRTNAGEIMYSVMHDEDGMKIIRMRMHRRVDRRTRAVMNRHKKTFWRLQENLRRFSVEPAFGWIWSHYPGISKLRRA